MDALASGCGREPSAHWRGGEDALVPLEPAALALLRLDVRVCLLSARAALRVAVRAAGDLGRPAGSGISVGTPSHQSPVETPTPPWMPRCSPSDHAAG